MSAVHVAAVATADGVNGGRRSSLRLSAGGRGGSGMAGPPPVVRLLDIRLPDDASGRRGSSGSASASNVRGSVSGDNASEALAPRSSAGHAAAAPEKPKKPRGKAAKSPADAPKPGEPEEGSRPRGPPLILPNSPASRAVQAAKLALGLYYVLAIPFRIAYSRPAAFGARYMLSDWGADLAFCALAAANLITPYQDKRGATEERLAKIAKKYAKSGLILDMIAILPFDLMAWAANLGCTAVVWLRINRFLATRPVLAYFRRRNADETSANTLDGVRKLLLFTMLIGHYGGCAFFYQAAQQEAAAFGEVGALTDVNWLAKLRHDASADLGSTFGSQYADGYGILEYLVSIFWSFAMMTSMGPGSISASNNVEVVAFLLANIVSLCFYSFVMLYLSDYMSGQHSETVKLRDEFLAIGRFVKERALRSDVAADLVTFFDFRAANKTSSEGIFRQLPRTLQLQVAREICRPLIADNRMFAACSPDFVDSLSVLLQEQTLMPGSTILRRNDPSTTLFFLASGLVEVTSVDPVTKAETKRELAVGSCVGEVAFFFGLRQTFTARVSAAGHCTLYTLSRREWQEIAAHHPDEEEQIFKKLLANVSDEDGQSVSGLSQGAESQASGKNLNQVLKEAKEKREQEKTTQMISEAHKGNLEGVKRFLLMDVDVDSADYDGRTALHLAASNGHTDVVHLLVDRGANVNARDRYGGTPLHDAVRHRQREAAVLLVRLGAIPQFEDEAAMLCAAAAEGELEKLQLLVDCGVDPSQADFAGRTALHLAACHGHRAVVEFLIQRGVDLNAADRSKGTPLQDAVRSGHFAVADLLAAAGAELRLRNVAGLMCNAALDGDVESINLLLRFGVPINEADYDGRTALHLAAAEGQLQAVEVLLRNGADANFEDNRGFRPLDDAARHERKLVAQLLMDSGAELGGAGGDARARRQSAERLARTLAMRRGGAHTARGSVSLRSEGPGGGGGGDTGRTPRSASFGIRAAVAAHRASMVPMGEEEKQQLKVKHGIAGSALKWDPNAGGVAKSDDEGDYDPRIVRAQEEFDKSVADLVAELDKETDRLRIEARRARAQSQRTHRSQARPAGGAAGSVCSDDSRSYQRPLRDGAAGSFANLAAALQLPAAAAPALEGEEEDAEEDAESQDSLAGFEAELEGGQASGGSTPPEKPPSPPAPNPLEPLFERVAPAVPPGPPEPGGFGSGDEVVEIDLQGLNGAPTPRAASPWAAFLPPRPQTEGSSVRGRPLDRRSSSMRSSSHVTIRTPPPASP